MYEELVKRLRLISKSRGGFIDLYGEAADAIEELSKPRWIPVTERLPSETDSVLVCTQHKNILVDRLHGIICNKYADFVKCGTNNVTHWMPLPTPPKEET